MEKQQHKNTTPTSTTESPQLQAPKRRKTAITKTHYTFDAQPHHIRGKLHGYTYYTEVSMLKKGETKPMILREGSIVVASGHSTPITVLLIRTTRGNETTSFVLLIPSFSTNNNTLCDTLLLSAVDAIQSVPAPETHIIKSEDLWHALEDHESKERAQQQVQHDQCQKAISQVLSTRHHTTQSTATMPEIAEALQALASAASKLATAADRLADEHEKDRAMFEKGMKLIEATQKNSLDFVERLALRMTDTHKKE